MECSDDSDRLSSVHRVSVLALLLLLLLLPLLLLLLALGRAPFASAVADLRAVRRLMRRCLRCCWLPPLFADDRLDSMEVMDPAEECDELAVAVRCRSRPVRRRDCCGEGAAAAVRRRCCCTGEEDTLGLVVGLLLPLAPLSVDDILRRYDGLRTSGR